MKTSNKVLSKKRSSDQQAGERAPKHVSKDKNFALARKQKSADDDLLQEDAGVNPNAAKIPSIREFAPSLLQGEEVPDDASFESVGLCPEVAAACRAAGWKTLTRIQAAVIPVALKEQRDIVGVAQTGSGKTGAYVLPALNWLLDQERQPFFSVLVLVPTRELAVQVADQFLMLGASIGLRVAALVGGEDMVGQAVELAKRPHVVVGTPGRVKDHMTNTRGFAMPKVKWFILDEADKMLEMDYEKEIDAIVEAIRPLGTASSTTGAGSAGALLAGPARQTMLFSATFSAKVDRLQRASLKNPVLLQVHRANTTVDTLKQYFIFAPFAEMLNYLHVYLARIEQGQHILVFCSSGAIVHKITLALRVLGHRALPLMGKMSQQNRLRALNQFKDKQVRVLVCTDVAQRGLDIPHVDVVVNFSLPLNVKEYIHRVGRTARAGGSGKAVNFVSQYDINLLQTIEAATSVTMEEVEIDEDVIRSTAQRVAEADMEAAREVREQERMEKLEHEQSNIGGGGGHSDNVANRRRGQGLDDAARGQDGFGSRRMRKENESHFQTTHKMQKRELAKKKVQSKKERR